MLLWRIKSLGSRSWLGIHGASTLTICTLVQGVCDVADEDAMEGFAVDIVEVFVEDAEEVTLSKTENLLQTVTEAATFSQGREETIDG